ncbi:cupredoxin domain-containing protein [Candidatus Woesearchaeota archaeon]|nr:cupredoxin domain-containing protein [Candidatus Woesearchaeota archaeon]
MRRIILFLVLAVFLASACSQTPAEKPEDFVGQGTPVESSMPVPGENIKETEVMGGNEPAAESVKEFKITAKQFSFTPETIEVNKGDRVRLLVTSTDVPHGISINEYGINERLDPGKEVKIEFTADKEGTFTAFCSVFCGSGHSNMKGKLIVK